MRVLFLAAELAPIAKVGGLADVVGELPRALKSLGVDLRVYIPFHQTIDRSNISYREIDEFLVSHQSGSEVAKIYLSIIDGVEVYLIDGDPIVAANGIYTDPAADGYKFTFFSLAALEASRSAEWKPDILHAHDWHTCAAVIWLNRNRNEDAFWEDTVSLLTVHNLPYMGAGGEGALSFYGLEPMEDKPLPEWAQHTPLPMGLATADWINAVSPTYSREIQTPTFGHGLESLISDRSNHVKGIINGIDLARWDPQTDIAFTNNFNRDNLKPRENVKASLLEEMELATDPKIPLLAIITRLEHQKGADLAISALSQLIEETWQLVILGTGDPALEEMAKEFESTYPDRIRSFVRFDAQLARNIYGGADMILIPSRYEPCGLTQMIAMRYGCVPIVAATGGLKDTVTDYRRDPKGTGFLFELEDGEEHVDAIRDALSVFRDKRRWRGLQRRGMAMDFSWLKSARRYLQLYEIASEERLYETGHT
jgi:starch synthase